MVLMLSSSNSCQLQCRNDFPIDPDQVIEMLLHIGNKEASKPNDDTALHHIDCAPSLFLLLVILQRNGINAKDSLGKAENMLKTISNPSYDVSDLHVSIHNCSPKSLSAELLNGILLVNPSTCLEVDLSGGGILLWMISLEMTVCV